MPDSSSTRRRANGWTEERRRLFLATLGQTRHVGNACAAVGLSRNAAYLLRQRDPAFAAAWRAVFVWTPPPAAPGLYDPFAPQPPRIRADGTIARPRDRTGVLLRQLRRLDKEAGLIW